MSKDFDKWYKNSQIQGNYEPWQYWEVRKLAWNAWKASRRYLKKKDKKHGKDL